MSNSGSTNGDCTSQDFEKSEDSAELTCDKNEDETEGTVIFEK
jgi:hypothetical protein